MQQGSTTYEIVLTQGINFHTLANFKTIYDNFFLPFYFTQLYRISMESMDEHEDGKTAGFTLSTDEKFFFHEIKRDFSPKEGQTDITKLQKYLKYVVNQKRLARFSGSTIEVFFRVQKTEQKIHFCIKVQDKEKWIYKNIYCNKQFRNGERICEPMNILKPNELQYYYMEPKNERNRVNDEEHFSIALQGGGVKGISYIGAYQALIKEHSESVKRKITSILGSSVGGILGLVICCELDIDDSFQIVSQLGNTPLQDRVKGVESPKVQQLYKNRIQLIKNILISYGILGEDIIEELEDFFNNRECQLALIQVLQASLGHDLAQLLIIQRKGEKQLNFCRLLSAGLMEGEVIRKIARKCLKNLYPQYNSIELQSITMKELYDKNHKEFTCTTVDLDDQVIRFLNHKTSPDLPVCSAVQMTGSFPIAIKAQKWKRQWGKYFIHYEYIRREVDLEGHEMTDGGTLSNFPIKYLDNEKIRPMYFSHPKTEKTVLYGFGVNKIPDEDFEKYKKDKMDNAVKNLKQKIQDHLGCCKISKIICKSIGKFCSSCCGTNVVSKQLECDKSENQLTLQAQLNQIPLIKFVFRLLSTYTKATDNFTKECFEQEIFHTSYALQDPKKWFGKYDHKQYTKTIKDIMFDCRRLLRPPELSENSTWEEYYNYTVKQLEITFKKLDQRIEYQKTKGLRESEILSIAMIYNSILTNYCMARKVMEENEEPEDIEEKKEIDLLHESLRNLDDISSAKYFYRECIFSDFIILEQISSFAKYYFLTSSKTNKKIQKGLGMCLKKNLNKSQDVLKQFSSYLYILEKEKHRKQYKGIPQYLTYGWVQLGRLFFLINIDDQKKLKERARTQLIVGQLPIAEQVSKKRKFLRTYVHEMLRKMPADSQKSVHIVLQSKNISQLYFNEYYHYCRQAICDFNINNGYHEDGFKIKSITSSNYHSIAALLFASNLSINEINEYCWKIKYYIELADRQVMENQFDTFKWTKLVAEKMREMEDEAWKNRFDIFQYLDEELSQNYTEEKLNDYENTAFNARIMIENSKAMMNDAFEETLNYVAEQISETEGIENLQQRVEKLRESFSVSKGGKKNYRAINKSKDKLSMQFYQDLIDRFGDVIRFILYLSPNMLSPMFQHLSEEERRIVWKGIILSSALSSLKIKNLIRKILQQMDYAPNVALKEFYEISPRKIQLNFLAIESVTHTLTIINHITRPNMPVWAAIFATCSLPYFFSSMTDHKQWRTTEIKDKNIQVENHFTKKSLKYEYLQSANYMSKIPLELVTNYKIRNLITDKKDEVFLTFSFDDITFERQNHPVFKYMKTLKSKPIDLWTVVNWFLLKGYQDHFSLFFGIPVISDRLKEFDLYVNSHDNLILSIYKKQSVMIPLQLNTLEFQRITKKKFQSREQLIETSLRYLADYYLEGGQSSYEAELALVTYKVINNSKYVTMEKVRNTKSEGYKLMFLQFDLKLDRKNKQNRLKIIVPSQPSLHFLSLSEKYLIQYRTTEEDKFEKFLGISSYKKLQDGKLILKNVNKDTKLWLKISYPYEYKQKEFILKTVYQCLSFEYFIFSQNSFGTYKFEFNRDYLLEEQEITCEEGRNYNPVMVKSYNDELWSQKFRCFHCGSTNIEMVRQHEQFNNVFQEVVFENKKRYLTLLQIPYKCQNKNCEKIILAHLKVKKNHILCPLDHEFLQINNRENDCEDQRIKNLRLCTLCKSFGQIIYEDGYCRISLCEYCRSELHLIE